MIPRMNDAAGRFAGARLLVVDDDAISIEMLAEILANMGVSAVLAHSGAQALATLEADAAFDGVLLDCEMPTGSGYDAARAIRQIEACAHLPILAMTGTVGGEHAARLEAAGMNGSITKPVRLRDLKMLLERWVRAGAPPADPRR